MLRTFGCRVSSCSVGDVLQSIVHYNTMHLFGTYQPGFRYQGLGCFLVR